MTEIDEYTVLMCRKGKHRMAMPWGECKECKSERAKRSRDRARHAQGFVDYDKMRQPPNWIPTAALAPIIRSYLQENEMQHLADPMGVPMKTLERWISGESRYARLDLVDRMLCEMDQTYHFYTTLAEFYFAGLEVDLAA